MKAPHVTNNDKPLPAQLAKPPGSYRHGDLKNALIAAAREFILSRGGPEFTMREIAALTGVRHAAVYRHFVSKDNLLQELGQVEYSNLRKMLAEKTEGGDQRPEDAIREAILTYVDFALSHPGEYKIISVAYGGKEPSFGGFAVWLRNLVENAQSAGGVRRDIAPEVLAFLLWAQAHGLVQLALGSSLTREDIEDCVKHLMPLWSTGATPSAQN